MILSCSEVRLQRRADLLLDVLRPAARVDAADLDVPASGSRSPMTHSSVVVLPAPFGPSRPKISPSAISKLTPSTADAVVVFAEILDDDLWHGLREDTSQTSVSLGSGLTVRSFQFVHGSRVPGLIGSTTGSRAAGSTPEG